MKKKLLIVDENLENARKIREYLKANNKQVAVVRAISDGENLEREIKEIKPDYILVELKTPNLKNLKFIENIKNPETKILIQSNNLKLINRIQYNYYKKIGKIYIKPYEIKILNEDLKKMDSDEPTIREKIEKELSKFNFNKGSKGYQYLSESIFQTYKDPNIIKNMEKELFPYLSSSIKLDTPNNVKWSLQKLMVSMIRYTDTEIILRYFPYTKRPTLKVFITTINSIVEKS